MSEKIQVLCPGCGAVNRVDLERAKSARPVCGRCKGELEPRAPGYPLPITDADFDSMVVRAGMPTLVDFWAPWCGPCRKLEPELEELARQEAGRLRVCKLNTEENPFTPQKYGIRGIPALILFRGIEVERRSGYAPLPDLKRFVERHL
ncbi:MAG: thioredoxin fold domain-containing protein [Armatimonadetes bacterium]|nr:thioredoxin fold domain-containing protein [Armatimonadota bacterium]